jgi:hypothetical protein
MTKLPASLRPLRGAATALQLKSPSGPLAIDPVANPDGYLEALGGSRDERVQEQRTAQDAASSVTDPGYAQTMFNRSFNRAQEDGAQGPAGFNRSWVPFFESQNVVADNHPGMKYQTNTSGLVDPPDTMPTGYTADRYKRELDTFAAGGAAPGFTHDDTSARPGVEQGFQAGMRRRAGSMAALAKQGGF